jgi:hypothetical protein
MGLIDLKVTEYLVEVDILKIEEPEEEVLDFDLIMGLGEAESGSLLKCRPAGIVQLAYEGFEV